MRLLTISFLVTFFIHYSKAINCVVDGVQGNTIISKYDKINDNAEEFITIPTENVKSAAIKPDQEFSYIDVVYMDNELIFKPSQEFKDDFEKNSEHTTQPRVNTKIILTCTDEESYEVDYYQSLNDINTFDPFFENPTYDFIIPMPIGGTVDLTLFGEAFFVTDYDISNGGIDFTIEGENSDLLEVVYVDRMDPEDPNCEPSTSKGKTHKGVLKTKHPLRLTKDTPYTITATDKGQPNTKSGTAMVNIIIDESATLPYSPSFAAGFYEADYDKSNEKHSIIMKTPIKVTQGVTKDNIKLSGDYADHFVHELEEDVLKISLDTNLPDNVISLEPFVGLSITASIDYAEVSATTSLIIAMAERTNINFPKVYYEALYFEENGVPKITDVIIDVTDDADVVLAGDYKEYFDYVVGEKSIIVNKIIPLINFEKWYIDVTIQASYGTAKAEAVLVVSPAAVITFEGGLVFEGDPSEGVSGKLTASSSIDEGIIFSFTENVPSELQEYLSLSDDGTFKTVNLPSGVHNIEILATGKISKASKVNIMMIKIGAGLTCPDGDPWNPYTFLAVTVKENEAESIVLPLPQGSIYSYEIVTIEPNKNRFDLNANGDFVAKSLDRESDEFGSGKARYTATINLIDKTQKKLSSKKNILKTIFTKETNLIGDNGCYSLDVIGNEPNQIIVGISVEDVNDNKPIFEKTKIVVGYPEYNLLKTVSPRYLISVKATDKDIGEFASLKYSVASSKVIIDENTGYVYPTKKIYDDDEVVKITATDDNGEGNASEQPLTLTIKILQKDHLCLLKYQDKQLEDLDTIMNSLAAYADVRYLSASVLPNSNSFSRVSNDRSLIITAYAFKIGTENLLTAEELIEILGDVSDLSMEPFPNPEDCTTEEPIVCSTETPTLCDEDCSKGGLIAGVVVLAILLALCIGGFIAFYVLKLRKLKSYNEMNEEENSQDMKKDITIQNPTFIKNPSSSTIHDVGLHTRRPTGYLYAPDIPDINEEEPSSPSEPSEVFNTDVKERLKSVAFNDNIEEINIERAADQDVDKTNLDEDGSGKL